MDASLVLALGPDRGADLAALVTDPPGTPLAVAADPRLLEETRRGAPRIASALAALDVEWVRTGWGADLSLLPLRTVRALLEREDAVLDSLGMSAPALWLRGADPCVLEALPPGVRLLLLDVERPGVVVRHAAVLPVLPVGPVVRVVSEIPLPDTPAGPTPSRRIAGEPPVGALPWPVPSPRPARLARRLARAASLARTDPDVLGALAAAAAPDAGEAEAVGARAVVDARAHRREEWTGYTELDWDADGLADIEIESPRLSLVVDPAESLGILTLDDMATREPLARPGGRLCATTPLPFVAGRVSRSRASVSVPFTADRITCRLTVDRWTLRLTYGVADGAPLRLGPDLRLAGVPAVRVDGSAWREPAESITGHRLRLDFGRRHVLVSSRLPSTFEFAVDDEGIGLAIHREVAPGSSYEVAIDLSAPSRTDRSDA